MKRLLCTILSLILTASLLPSAIVADAAGTVNISYNYSYNLANGYDKNDNLHRQMESLGRGLVAVSTNDGVFLSWRLLDSEDVILGSANNNVSFNVYRNGTKITSEPLKTVTNYLDATKGTSYAVAPVINGVEGQKCAAVSVWNNNYIEIPLSKPAAETVVYKYPYTPVDDNNNPLTDSNGNPIVYTSAIYSFSPTDCSTGDLDGDGEYEIIVKWVSSERDVGSPGNPSYSGTVRFNAYKLDGTKLWDNDINLGKNVYSSAHTVQFLVYDFDGDGKSEMICQTSLGSTDSKGRYVSHAAKAGATAATGRVIADFTDEDNASADYRGYGRITEGEEFLTVFNGQTGAAIDTIDLPTSRGSANGVDYGDDFGNRSNRFTADVAYLDGVKPYAVYLRGYYFGRNGRQRTSIAGVSFDGQRLSPDYRFDTQKGQPGYYEGAYQFVGNGNHNCTVADVDNDGKDEFITGALCMEVKDDNSFKPRWCTFMEHGDALHIGDYDPTHPGFEFFTVHEDGGPNTMSGTEVLINYGASVIDADTGEIMFHKTANKDTGRGMMANVGAGGYYQINGGNQVSTHIANGGTSFTEITNKKYSMSNNFRIFWDGDLYDELLDGTNITSWNGSQMQSIFNSSSYGCVQINGSKANPALQADLFGDWREELVYPTSNGNALRVFTSTTPTEYKIKTLMHDPVYRSGVAAQQTAYNQPPHVGFYMGDEVFKQKPTSIAITSQPDKTLFYAGQTLDTTGLVVTAYFSDNTSEVVTDYTTKGYNMDAAGNQTVTISYLGKTASYGITVLEPSIEAINGDYVTSSSSESGFIPIGSYSGSFVIEHKVTINSMPANGSTDKNSTAGFYMRFNPNDGTGAGWYLTENKGKANVIWKSTSTNTVAQNLNIGETYTFRYEFIRVAKPIQTGVDSNNKPTYDAAAVTMTVLDSSGNTVGSLGKLNLRNMTNDNQKESPLGNVEIYNQAKTGETASVSITDATLSIPSGITYISDNKFSIYLGGATNKAVRAFFAKYASDGTLDLIDTADIDIGDNQLPELSFEPDKVFLWNGMEPLSTFGKKSNKATKKAAMGGFHKTV